MAQRGLLGLSDIIPCMIKDQKRWDQGNAMLDGFARNVPTPVSEKAVQQYHDIVGILEEASGEDLSAFAIPPEKLEPRLLGSRRGSFRGGRGSSIYSKEKSCEEDFFLSKLQALVRYLPTLRGAQSMKETSYDLLSDIVIEEMMINRNIKPKRIVTATGEQWVYDREGHHIAVSVKVIRAQPTSTVSNVFNIRDSNFVHSSPGSSIAQNVGIKPNELSAILGQLRQLIA